VPGGAAKLAVGRRAEANLFLLAHDLLDRLVLEATELVGVDPAGAEVVARLQQTRRAKQAADVVGAERGLRA
jgi:ABC-type taurine transport system ATPase subunit